MDAIIERTIEEEHLCFFSSLGWESWTNCPGRLARRMGCTESQSQRERKCCCINQPQNALLHERPIKFFLNWAPQILLPIIQDGITAGVWGPTIPTKAWKWFLLIHYKLLAAVFRLWKKQQQTQIYLFRNHFSQPAKTTSILSIPDSDSKQLELSIRFTIYTYWRHKIKEATMKQSGFGALSWFGLEASSLGNRLWYFLSLRCFIFQLTGFGFCFFFCYSLCFLPGLLVTPLAGILADYDRVLMALGDGLSG